MSSLDSTQNWTPLSPITVINCLIFSAYLLNKIKTYNNKKYPTM